MQKTPNYKRCLWLIVALVMLALPAMSLAADYYVIKGGSLNLRQEASTDSNVLGQYPSGTWVSVLSASDGWSKVNVNGKTGYVMSKYLTNASSSAVMYIRTNTGKGLNMRNAPSLTGDIITSYANGGKVNVLIKGIGFHKVSVNSTVGYMASNFLAAQASGSTQTNTNGYPKTGVVSNPGSKQVLLLRETASTSAKVIGYYGNGVSVKLLGETGSFYKVTVDGKSGYMMKKYIKVAGPSPSAGFPDTPFAALLKNPNGGSVVNFRWAPGLNTSIIKAYPVGTEITVLSVGENWCKAEIGGVQGYVSTYFFKVK